MKIARKQFGMTLVETTVTVAIVSLLAVLSTPSIRAYFDAIGSPAEVKGAIGAAFASARAIAAKKQHYAGVRFQQDSSGKQYMIFIINDPAIGATFFRAADGEKPIKLPDNIGVMDLKLGSTGSDISLNTDISNDWQVTDTTTFSIIFSPAGKMVIHNDVRVRNRDGIIDSTSGNGHFSEDDVFNKKADVDAGTGMFYQDDYYSSSGLTNSYGELGLGPESSRNSFVIYDKTEFNKVDPARRWTDYLYKLASEVIYINPYTGTIIQGQ
ncbi:MAG: type II secretion system protein [Planctomycetota bacterium]|nr:type II secretion system protein [Planctomycetota bacterium]